MWRNGNVKVMKQKSYIPNLEGIYTEKVVPEMMKKYEYKNIFQVPRLKKVVINIGLSEAKENAKVVDVASQELSAITGQKPKICRAKRAISNFRLRKGMPIGLKITLRRRRMYEFIERLVSCGIPRMRDFRGLNMSGFDNQGNFNLGLTEQYIFPEIMLDKSDKARGMNISFITTAKSKEESKDMFVFLGMPFRKK